MKFKLSQQSYIDCETDNLGAALRDAGFIFDLKPDTKQLPGPHWEPMDDEAKALCAKHSIKFTGEVPDSMDKISQIAQANMKRDTDAGSPGKIGAAVVDALIDAGVVKGTKRPAASADI